MSRVMESPSQVRDLTTMSTVQSAWSAGVVGLLRFVYLASSAVLIASLATDCADSEAGGLAAGERVHRRGTGCR
ncbi:hypothetical protein ACIQNU_39150 [Streptomyces sp. NPDC091292]|uniref:hypothetical protein n=1 Tax=Streptomyces sp. NPDC091292 TaxID=3365991 RepID=UPI0038142178